MIDYKLCSACLLDVLDELTPLTVVTQVIPESCEECGGDLVIDYDNFEDFWAAVEADIKGRE